MLLQKILSKLKRGSIMRRNLGKIILIALFSSLWQACISSGRDFPSRLDWITKEQTKKEDVALVLGKPYAVGNSSGVPTWTYAFYKYSPFSSYYKELRFYWADEKVQTFTFNSSFPEDLHVGKTN
jgi:hypothetical protein